MRDYIQGASGRVPVVKIEHGQKIREPGVYEMPMLWYHDDCCAGPSISSSGLRKIKTHSARHFYDTAPFNPDRDEDAMDDLEDKEAIRLGRAVHTLLLEPEHFASNFITRPAIWADWRTKAAKDWRAEQQVAGRTVMDAAEMVRVSAMAQAIRNHATAPDLLDGDIERSLIWRDYRTGVWLKARPDAIPRGSNILGDLKCLRDVRDEPLRRAIFDAGYDMQMGLVAVGMRTVLGRVIEDHVLIPVESKRPHCVVTRPIAPDEIGRAMLYLRRSINIFAECVSTGEWPGPEGDDTHLTRTPFERKKFEDDLKYGLIPQEF